ncbi:DUF2281 domain-containing protein [Breznakiellaceae bacterium SP9]
MIAIQQTLIQCLVDIPASHRLTIEVPLEVPAGRTLITFTPKPLTPRERVFGCAKGQFRMADDFDAPLDDFKDYM